MACEGRSLRPRRSGPALVRSSTRTPGSFLSKRCDYPTKYPPSIPIVSPVMYPETLEAKNATKLAILEASPKRPMGILSRIFLLSSGANLFFIHRSFDHNRGDSINVDSHRG